MGLTSLDGIENWKDLTQLDCRSNELTSLKGVEALGKLKRFSCRNNNLESLEGIEKLSSLKKLWFRGNPCSHRYDAEGNDEIDLEEVLQKVNVELHLKHGDDLRGAASILDTGLFDFKI
jgi:Leucine-rich repeat (LRR) protein